MKKETGSILLLDDDSLIMMNYADLLREIGYDCKCANTLEKAWHMLKNFNFDVIICDHDLQFRKGIELLERMKNQKNHTPVVYISAANSGILSDINSYQNVKKQLHKPISEITLLNTIRDIIGSGDETMSLHPRLIKPQEREMLFKVLNFN